MAIIEKTHWRVVGPLLDDLLDADSSERVARLAEIRRTDPGLATDLEVLLAREAAIDREAFLEGSALQEEATLSGKVIGSYTVDHLLGQGGMGSVWLAHRSDGRFEGQAAVKFLNLALVGRGGAERFRREGQVLAKLVHPGIARLIDAGIAHGGQPYLMLEYVDGAPIDRWCDRHALDLEARVRLFLEVLRAVEYAHSNLILHRDLKPANILVTREGRVKLLDFGIAKLLDDRTQNAQSTELTQLAGRAFTPEYAAPEQIRGEDVTTATDVYALGVLLYRLLSGEHPTALPTVGPADQLRAVIENVPARLSVAAARTMQRSVQEPSAYGDTAGARAARRPRQHRGKGSKEVTARALHDGGRARRRSEPLSEQRAGHRARGFAQLPHRQVRATPPARRRRGVSDAARIDRRCDRHDLAGDRGAPRARRRYLSGRTRVRQGQPGQPNAGSDRRLPTAR